VFVVSGALIAGNLLYVYVFSPRLRARGAACAADAPDACDTASRVSWVVLWVSTGLYLVGFFTAYLLGPLLTGLD
jgi:hypothetical protein